MCHGSDAGGVRGFPSLRDEVWQWGGAPAEIKATILAGRNAAMPGWREALCGDPGVEEVTAYVLSLSGSPADAAKAAKAAAGKERYDSLCVARHGAEGIAGLRLDAERGDREVASGEIASVPVRLDAPREALPAASTPVRFTIEAIGAGDIHATEEARFLGPADGQ